MSLCPNNQYKITFFNSFICSLISLRFIIYLMASLLFLTSVILLVGDVYVYMFGGKEWDHLKNYYQLFSFNLYTAATILLLIVNLYSIYFSVSFIYKMKFYSVEWVRAIIKFIIFLALILYPFYKLFDFVSILKQFNTYTLDSNLLLIFLVFLLIWFYLYLFFTYFGEKFLLVYKD